MRDPLHSVQILLYWLKVYVLLRVVAELINKDVWYMHMFNMFCFLLGDTNNGWTEWRILIYYVRTSMVVISS